MSIVRRAGWLTLSRYGFDTAACALGPLIGALVALLAGQETSWDFRNYHWYNAYALLTWRYDQDVAVAHHATYNNPVLDIPYFLAGNALPPALTLALLGAVTGLNFSLLYLIARSVFTGFAVPAARLAALATAAIGFLGGMSFLLIATTYYDNVVSLLVLGALLELLKLRVSEPRGGAREYPGCAARERTDHHGGLVQWGVAARPHEFREHFTDHEERRHTSNVSDPRPVGLAPHSQSTVTISIGSDVPRKVTVRGSEIG